MRRAVIDGKPASDDRSLITPAYKFFSRRLRELVKESGVGSIQQLHDALVSKITFVMVTLEKENPFAIFESLNGTGQKLEESDLIRNQVFMGVEFEKQDAFDQEHWQPFEQHLSGEGASPRIPMTDFYRDFLMRVGGQVKKGSIHATFKSRLENEGTRIDDLVETLKANAEFYRWIHRPSTCSSAKVRKELSCMSRIKISTYYALALHLCHLHKISVISEDDLASCLRIIQSFIIRRQIVGESNKSYWFYFSEAIQATKAENGNIVKASCDEAQ